MVNNKEVKEFSGIEKSSMNLSDHIIFANNSEIIFYLIKENKILKNSDYPIKLTMQDLLVSLARSIGINAQEYIKEVSKGFEIDGKLTTVKSSGMNSDDFENKKKAIQIFCEGVLVLKPEYQFALVEELLRMGSSVENMYEEIAVSNLMQAINNYCQDKGIQINKDYNQIKDLKEELISGQIIGKLEINSDMQNLITKVLRPISKDLQSYYKIAEPRFDVNWMRNVGKNIVQTFEKLTEKIFEGTETGELITKKLEKERKEIFKNYFYNVTKPAKSYNNDELADMYELIKSSDSEEDIRTNISVVFNQTFINFMKDEENEKENLIKDTIKVFLGLKTVNMVGLSVMFFIKKMFNEDVGSKTKNGVGTNSLYDSIAVETKNNIKEHIKGLIKERENILKSEIIEDNIIDKLIDINELIKIRLLKNIISDESFLPFRGVQSSSTSSMQRIEFLKEMEIRESKNCYIDNSLRKEIEQNKANYHEILLRATKNIIGDCMEEILKEAVVNGESFKMDLYERTSGYYLKLALKDEYRGIVAQLIDLGLNMPSDKTGDLLNESLLSKYEEWRMKEDLKKSKTAQNPIIKKTKKF